MTSSVGDGLFELHEAGRLAAEYPRVGGLVERLAPADRRRAGQVLARLDAADVLRAHPDTPAVTVAITGHGTMAGLVPALTAEVARHGLLLRPYVSHFDGYVFDLGDPGSELYAADPDVVLCVLDPMVIFDEVPVPWRPDDVERVAREKLALLRRLAERFAEAGRGTLVMNTVPLLRRFTAQLVDHRSRARLGVVWRELNARLLELTEDRPELVVVDLDPLVAETEAVQDLRASVYAKAHLSAGLLGAYAREAGHLVRHLTGRGKKCLAVDLDNTIWGGVLGDDGVDGIEVAEGRRGAAFEGFQRVVKQLGSQGVLLAAVSKNDQEAVRGALRDHPEMVLREDDFVRVAANWRPKTDNITELTGDLNIGVDSVVFVDDSPYERGLVRRELPGVAVVDVDGEPALHAQRLLADGWFDVRELTGDDLMRPARYREELDRKDFLQSFDSLTDYLRELDVRVSLTVADEADVPRVSQITLRTNQFNLTTVRLQPPDVRALLAGPATPVLTIRSSDRFGDNGTVGAVFLRRDGDAVHIDNFLLSCRVFSRGIEQACLAAVLRHARATGAREVLGAYRATAKNHGVADFYPRHGFVPAAGEGTYRHDLSDIISPPGHVSLTVGLEGLEGMAS